MSTSYNYSIINDFKSTAKVDFDQLQYKLNQLYPTNANYICQIDDIIEIFFKTSLTTNEILLLDTTIDTFTNIYLANTITNSNTVVICEKQPIATNGGTSIANVWMQRILNNINYSNLSWVTLNNDNTFSLTSGQYHININCPSGGSTNSQIHLYNCDTNNIEIEGVSSIGQNATLQGNIIINLVHIFKVMHKFKSGCENVGLGWAGGFSNETYTTITINKLL